MSSSGVLLMPSGVHLPIDDRCSTQQTDLQWNRLTSAWINLWNILVRWFLVIPW